MVGKSNILDAIGLAGHLSKLIWNIDVVLNLDKGKENIANVEIPVAAQYTVSNPAYKPEGDWTTMLSDNCYRPSTITVRVGSTVTWVNKDTISHTVTYAKNPLDASTWDRDGKILSGMKLIVPNQSFRWTFDKEGEYPYLCYLHPWMIGRVIVVGILKSVMVYPYSNSIIFDLYRPNYDTTISVTISPRILRDPSRFS